MDMALPGLWENVISTKVYLPQMAPIYVWQTLVPKMGQLEPPEVGRTKLTAVKNVSVHAPACATLGLVPMWSSGRQLPKMEGCGVLQDLIPEGGSWYFPRFLLREVHKLIWTWPLDGPGNPVCFTAQNRETVHTDAVPCSITMFVKGEGIPKVLLKPVPKGPCQLLNLFFSKALLGVLNWYFIPHFLVIESLYLGPTKGWFYYCCWYLVPGTRAWMVLNLWLILVWSVFQAHEG